MADNDNIGSDFSCVTDVTPGLRVVDGRKCLAQAVARRLITERGGLFYDANYGVDTRAWLGKAEAYRGVRRKIEDQAYQDERIKAASCDAQFTNAREADSESEGDKLSIELDLVDDTGPFSLSLDVSAVTVTLLET